MPPRFQCGRGSLDNLTKSQKAKCLQTTRWPSSGVSVHRLGPPLEAAPGPAAALRAPHVRSEPRGSAAASPAAMQDNYALTFNSTRRAYRKELRGVARHYENALMVVVQHAMSRQERTHTQ